LSGLVVPLNMRVQYISFSAHADFTQTSAFLNRVDYRGSYLTCGARTRRTLV
jgi:Cft2 family RNA processing exonuclease